jgi:hypothetical protein
MAAVFFEPGDKVCYVPEHGKLENGIVKSHSDENHVFVVYNCGGDWENYQNYTAARTHTDNLVKGWKKVGI